MSRLQCIKDPKMETVMEKSVEVPTNLLPKDEQTTTDENATMASETLPDDKLDSEICNESNCTEADNTNCSPLVEAVVETVDVSCSSSSASKPKQNNDFDERPNSIYHIKWISQNGIKTPIVTQNENGPCPLIAIINVLIMRGRVKLDSIVDIVTSEKLMEYLGDCILESIPKNIPEGAQLNYEQNIHDAMAVLHKLQTGLDVNVKFTGISDFEYTPECIVFDLLRIPLYHGWLVDPQTPDVQKAVGTCSYNQLVEKIINWKSSPDTEKATAALIAENFLEKTASQLTYHGLCELTATIKEAELCVLFRNNHFTLIVKHKDQLYQLVTDQGFLNECNVVWETLNNIEGDGQFVDASFLLVPPKPADSIIPPMVSEGQQIDQDYLVALSLQEEQQKLQNSDLEWEEFKKKRLGVTNGLTDEELARRLQEEEDRAESHHELPPAQQQQQQQQPVPPSSNRNKSRDCTIL